MEALNERIKKCRKDKGLTQSQLAEILGVTDKAVSKWEVGEANPDIELLVKMSELFNVTLDYLLTGVKKEKEILIVSPREMLIKNDDPQYLPQISQNDLTLDDIYKNELANVFACLVDNKSIRSYMRGRYGNPNDCVKQILYLSLLSNRLDKLDVFGFQDIGFVAENEWMEKMTQAFVSDARVSDATREYVLSSHERLNATRNGKALVGHVKGNWQSLYPRLLEGFAEAKKWDWVSKVLDIFESINRAALEEYEKVKDFKYDNGDRYYLTDVPATYNIHMGFHVVSVSSKTLATLLEKKQFALLDRANALNKAIGKFAYSKKTIDVAKLKADDSLFEQEKFERECVYDHIINVSLLSSCRDLSVVRRILDNNYYHYYEMIHDFVARGEIKKAFEFLIDNGYESVAQYLLPREGKTNYGKALAMAFGAFTTRKGYYGFDGHEEFLANQNPLGIEGGSSLEAARNDFAKALTGKNADISRLASLIEDNPIIAFIKAKKEEIYQNVVRNLAAEEQRKKEQIEREKIAKGLTKEYFEGLLEQGKPENLKLFHLELCALLDAIFLYDYHYQGKDFSERMNAHFKSLHDALPQERLMDDGWGYQVADTKYTDEVVIPARERVDRLQNIFYRLRISRNNIVHPEKVQVKELSVDEMRECLEYVFAINRK